MRQGDNVFRYDANGRMVEKTLKRDGFRAQTRFYHWDEEDRLIRVSLPNGDIWHYEYDVFGRRCRKYRQQPAPQPTSAQSLTQQISQGDIRYQWLVISTAVVAPEPWVEPARLKSRIYA
ncbi:YD repeat-containing protein [Shewanella chilikensis]|uniref:YD repeat-containing protein n=2 Tax=Shewanella TaxID=22 RepID=A0ABX5PHD9_9GAMM|nr:RHS repeat domain-containing protein [Shewanella chilikensis]PYE53218.1 YD repeat-containing protein [Shewanella chilikensis]